MFGRLKLAIKVFISPGIASKKQNPLQIEILNLLGQERSIIEQQSIDKDGNPIPWFTYPAIEYLSQLDLSEYSILEWGCGNSTKFFARRCHSIISMEHNKEWYDRIEGELPANSKLMLVPEADYPEAPLNLSQQFDLIIVDGIKRHECLLTAIQLIKPTGFILFDNSDRNPDYCAELRAKGFLEIDFHGFGPQVQFTTTTSLFFSTASTIKALGNMPKIPVGGGY